MSTPITLNYTRLGGDCVEHNFKDPWSETFYQLRKQLLCTQNLIKSASLCLSLLEIL